MSDLLLCVGGPLDGRWTGFVGPYLFAPKKRDWLDVFKPARKRTWKERLFTLPWHPLVKYEWPAPCWADIGYDRETYTVQRYAVQFKGGKALSFYVHDSLRPRGLEMAMLAEAMLKRDPPAVFFAAHPDFDEDAT